VGRSLRNHRPDLSGVLVVDKPLGISSAAVCNAIRRRSGGAKVGHAGTLDPLATGVLVVCLGKATKSIPQIQAAPKRYLAEVDLSAFTTTDDAEGEREEIAVEAPPDVEAVQQACRGFEGEIDQRPPVFSAVHIEGQRAYEKARKGELTERPAAKRVRIDAVDVVDYAWPIATLDVRSGKGVYIRSLARDLGERLGTGGTLRSLRRTAVGEYTIDRATPLDDLPERAEEWTAGMLLAAPEPAGRDQSRSRS
jgi:tRNA pseudouridine55 synthase